MVFAPGHRCVSVVFSAVLAHVMFHRESEPAGQPTNAEEFNFNMSRASNHFSSPSPLPLRVFFLFFVLGSVYSLARIQT